MKSYPSIAKEPRYGESVYAFGKQDGSQVRVEWNRKNSFHKWGRRNGLLDDSNPILKRFPDLFLGKYGVGLEEALRKARFESVTCFAEFWGPSSFAGTHVESEEQTCTLFDVDVYKKGLLEPSEFLKLFGHLPVQELLYQGVYNREIEQQIQQGTLPGIPLEGVVCKRARDRKNGSPLMFKVKQTAWMTRLKEHCKGDDRLFQLLA